MTKITFVGGGNMAAAIAGGLIANGTSPGEITIVDPRADQRERLHKDLGVEVSEETSTTCSFSEIIILAVKPQVIPDVAAQIKTASNLDDKLLISIAAGVPLSELEALLGNIAIVRTMPNTPALMGLGATGLYANAHTPRHN